MNTHEEIWETIHNEAEARQVIASLRAHVAAEAPEPDLDQPLIGAPE